MASRRLQHLVQQLATAAPRGAAPARALPASDPLPVGSANRQGGVEDDLNKLAGDAGVPAAVDAEGQISLFVLIGQSSMAIEDGRYMTQPLVDLLKWCLATPCRPPTFWGGRPGLRCKELGRFKCVATLFHPA